MISKSLETRVTYAKKSVPTRAATIPNIVALLLLAPPTKGIGLDPGFVLPTGALALPTIVPKVVTPIGLFPFGPGVGVGVAGTGAGDPAASPTFGLEEPEAPGAVVKPT